MNLLSASLLVSSADAFIASTVARHRGSCCVTPSSRPNASPVMNPQRFIDGVSVYNRVKRAGDDEANDPVRETWVHFKDHTSFYGKWWRSSGPSWQGDFSSAEVTVSCPTPAYSPMHWRARRQLLAQISGTTLEAVDPRVGQGASIQAERVIEWAIGTCEWYPYDSIERHFLSADSAVFDRSARAPKNVNSRRVFVCFIPATIEQRLMRELSGREVSASPLSRAFPVRFGSCPAEQHGIARDPSSKSPRHFDGNLQQALLMQADGLQPDIYRFAGLHEYDELFFRRGGGMKHDKLEKRLPELVRSAVDELEHLGRTGNTGDGEDPDHYIGVDWREGTGLCDREVPVQSSGPARLLLYGASGLGKSFLALSLQCLERGGTGSPYDPADDIINDNVIQQVSSGILWNRAVSVFETDSWPRAQKVPAFSVASPIASRSTEEVQPCHPCHYDIIVVGNKHGFTIENVLVALPQDGRPVWIGRLFDCTDA